MLCAVWIQEKRWKICGKYARKKHQTIVRNETNLYAKTALNYIILKVILGNDNIHV